MSILDALFGSPVQRGISSQMDQEYNPMYSDQADNGNPLEYLSKLIGYQGMPEMGGAQTSPSDPNLPTFGGLPPSGSGEQRLAGLDSLGEGPPGSTATNSGDVGGAVAGMLGGSPQANSLPQAGNGLAGPGGISERGAIPGSDGGYDGADVVVQGFKPKKRSFLGFLGDVLGQHYGAGNIFQHRVDQKNVRRAMEGFVDNPLEAIRRLSMIDGHQADAWKMYSQYRDDQRGDEAQQSLADSRKEKVVQQSAGVLGMLNSDGSNWKMVANLYNNAMDRNKIDFHLDPDNPDMEYARALYTGAQSPDKQEYARYRDEVLKIRRERLDQTGRDTDSKIEDRTVRQGIAQQNADAHTTSANRPRAGGKGKAGVTPGGGGTGKTMNIRDSKGGVRQVVFSPDGKTAMEQRPDGMMVRYSVNGGKLTVVGKFRPGEKK